MDATHMLRILIADDHEIVRAGLRRILEAETEWEVVAEAGDGKEAIGKAVETKPDIAVLDYSMPLITGVEATRQIRARLPKTEVLIFSIHDEDVLIEQCLRAGARAYVIKSDIGRELVEAVQCLAAHKPFFTTKASAILLDTILTLPSKSIPLSDRWRCMVQMIAQGHTNKEIARTLDLGMTTVEKERKLLMRKLNLTSSAGIVRYAIRSGLVEP